MIGVTKFLKYKTQKICAVYFHLAFLKNLKTRHTFRGETRLGLAAPDHTVPYGTVLSRDAFPGTSCQATINLSLRDKSHSPIRLTPFAETLFGADVPWDFRRRFTESQTI
jgi:hypothetical protein